MAKTTTTFLKSKVYEFPYHFTCNYCGKVNNKIARPLIEASETHRGAYYGNVGGTLLDVQLEQQTAINAQLWTTETEKRLSDYGEGLREGRKFKYSLFFQSLKGTHLDHIDDSEHINSVCVHCGKKQIWAADPTKGTALSGVLGLVLADLLAAGGFIIAGSIGNGFWSSLFGYLGLLFFLGGFVFDVLIAKRLLKKNQNKIAAEPNDTNKLPVLGFGVFEDVELLETPVKINIRREHSLKNYGIPLMFNLNNKNISELQDGECITAMTNQKHNILCAYNSGVRNHFYRLVFEVTSGSEAEVHFKASKFLPEKCNGITVVSNMK